MRFFFTVIPVYLQLHGWNSNGGNGYFLLPLNRCRNVYKQKGKISTDRRLPVPVSQLLVVKMEVGGGGLKRAAAVGLPKLREIFRRQRRDSEPVNYNPHFL